MSKNIKNLLHCPKCNNEFPSQGRGRYVHIVDVIRANQSAVGWSLTALAEGDSQDAKLALTQLHKSDQDALLQEGGILNDAQIKLLK